MDTPGQEARVDAEGRIPERESPGGGGGMFGAGTGIRRAYRTCEVPRRMTGPTTKLHTPARGRERRAGPQAPGREVRAPRRSEQ